MSIGHELGCVLWLSLFCLSFALPDLRDNSRDPINVIAGEEALLPCTVKDKEDNTVIWKRVKFGRAEILSAGTTRVTSDSRFTVIHTKGGDEWVLSINPSRASDTAQYICEVNSTPSVRVFLLLQVASPLPPQPTPFPIGHNYTDCCVRQNVPSSCHGFCNLRNIILGQTSTSAHDCQDSLAAIAFCMADGRNHEPCCIRENIPEICREVCRGEYSLQSASVFHHYTCSYYSQATLACIAQGVDVLPGPPVDVSAKSLTDEEVNLEWKAPHQNPDSITHYIVNVTELKAFDELEQVGDDESEMGEEEEYFPADGTMPPALGKVERQGRQQRQQQQQPPQNTAEKFTEIKVNGNQTSLKLKDLKPYTMYEIYVVSFNAHGSSLPSYKIRTLTLMPKGDVDTEFQGREKNGSLPQLPDVRACCIREGLPMQSCLHRFCDPTRADEIGLTDLMICAPWVGITVPCLTQRQDHTHCCKQRGLPDLCVNLCQGNISRIDFQYFQCLPYMSVYANCLMEGYGVLPSQPRGLVVNNINPTWAILHWQPPEKLADTVLYYNVHIRSLAETEPTYIPINNTNSPFLLEKLESDTEYEVYVAAVNEYGVSVGSGRIIFRTDSLIIDEITGTQLPATDSGPAEDAVSWQLGYNVSECCVQAGVNKSCFALCNYHTKLSEVREVLPSCVMDFHRILKCGVGGRNHIPCCKRRGVQSSCLDLCAGVVKQTFNSIATTCVSDLINIIECMEEGSQLLPAAVHAFHVINLNSTSVLLEWEPPPGDNIVHYEVNYRKEEITDTIKFKRKITNDTSAIISNLDTNSTYSFYVMSGNEYGVSLPSAVARVNLTSATEGDAVLGVSSGPVGLAVRTKNITYMEIVWLPPELSHPSEQLKYKFHYMSVNDSIPHSVTTTSLGLRITDLTPNTEYVMYVTALSDRGESQAEQVLRVWTDPVYPAFVEAPQIHPSPQVIEGGNMSVMCVAMGTPVPTVSVLINGQPFAQQQTNHMIVHVQNVSREIVTVACFADNGYGTMQATKRIQISFAPAVWAGEAVQALDGDTAIIECLVMAYPPPMLEWWRDINGVRQKLNEEDYHIRTAHDDRNRYTMHLRIENVTKDYQGAYYCQAENPFGHAMQTVAIHVQSIPQMPENSVRDCCIAQQVAAECMDACTVDIDIEVISQRIQCISEMHKLMYCASDGSDHRRCCLGWGVPRRCLGWCHGKSIRHGAMCIFSFGRQVISCFQEGKDLLPGPPQNVDAKSLDEGTVQLRWDPPAKNPDMVQFYRVSWKRAGSGKFAKFHNDTHGLSIIIHNLIQGEQYEFVVKAANHHGSSTITAPLSYVLTDNVEHFDYNTGQQAGLIVGLIILFIVLIVVGVFGFFYYRKRQNLAGSGGISFENPSYNRDNTSDTIQITRAQETNGGYFPDGWKHETLHAPDMPVSSYYEELSNVANNGNAKSPKEVL